MNRWQGEHHSSIKNMIYTLKVLIQGQKKPPYVSTWHEIQLHLGFRTLVHKRKKNLV